MTIILGRSYTHYSRIIKQTTFGILSELVEASKFKLISFDLKRRSSSRDKINLFIFRHSVQIEELTYGSVVLPKRSISINMLIFFTEDDLKSLV